MIRPKIKILFITCFGDLRGGGQRSLLLLLERLDRGRFDPVLVVPDPGELKDAAARMGIDVVIMSFPRIRSLAILSVIRRLSELIQLVRRRQVALICTDAPRET